MRRARGVTLVALTPLMVAVLALTSACGGSDDSGATDAAGSSSSDAGSSETTKTIDITISGDSVTPNGDRVDVAVGQPIELDITSDAAGEIHVHSDPEHEYEIEAGTTQETFTIDRPGVVAIESHTLDKTIVQLYVS